MGRCASPRTTGGREAEEGTAAHNTAGRHGGVGRHWRDARAASPQAGANGRWAGASANASAVGQDLHEICLCPWKARGSRDAALMSRSADGALERWSAAVECPVPARAPHKALGGPPRVRGCGNVCGPLSVCVIMWCREGPPCNPVWVCRRADVYTRPQRTRRHCPCPERVYVSVCV